jgi:hypothetical protein
MKNNIWETGTFFGVPASFFFIPFCSRIHPEFAAIYADLSGDLGDFILMNPGGLSRRTVVAVLMGVGGLF